MLAPCTLAFGQLLLCGKRPSLASINLPHTIPP
nr:MAG TPA: hypothetical protein [Herelleviridae sp.]